MRLRFAEFYPPDAPASPSRNTHMVSAAAYKRVAGLISRTEGKVIIGGLKEADESLKYIPPTIVRDVEPSDALMQEEIFGPVLPILAIDKLEDAIPFINARYGLSS